MTDDKGTGEGPYRSEEVKEGYSVVFGPGLYPGGNRACFGEDLQSTLNYAYADGRKSMEKEFKEAIGWADSICLDWNYSKDYKKWKKARGIE